MNQQVLISELEKQGFQARMVSIEHLKDLVQDINNKMDSGLIEGDNLRAMLKRNFDFDILSAFPDARSFIVIAAPHPMSSVLFHMPGYLHNVIIPPTYVNQEVIEKAKIALEGALIPEGFQVTKVKLPCKLMAVRSGLGMYGRNNICYVDGMGSFCWLGVYCTDMACDIDTWGEYMTMPSCSKCIACVKACPTGAIRTDRFLLHGKKCITLYNESVEGFPEWLEDSYHNALVGCMACQLACPVNEMNLDNVVSTVVFEEEETQQILDRVPLEMLSEQTVTKLDAIAWKDEYAYLHRNLTLLIDIEKK